MPTLAGYLKRADELGNFTMLNSVLCSAIKYKTFETQISNMSILTHVSEKFLKGCVNTTHSQILHSFSSYTSGCSEKGENWQSLSIL